MPSTGAVEKPLDVNPDRRLRVLAAERDWPIHNFRVVGGRFASIAVGGSAVLGAALGATALHRRQSRPRL